MKKLLLQAITLFITATGFAQVNATAPDFDVTDINGNQIRLYADILDQGLIAIVDVSATWCGPCWNLHQSHVLRELHELYGPNGTNQLRVVFYEGDASTDMSDLQGTGSGSQGDWLTGTTYPVVNEAPLSLNLGIWAPEGFPTVNVIRPSDKKIVADTWNIFTLQGQLDVINSETGISVGISTQPENLVFSIFPNPAADFVNIQSDAFKGDVNVEIYNLQGQLVKTSKLSLSAEGIDVRELPEGKYLLRAFDLENSTTQRLSIKH